MPSSYQSTYRVPFLAILVLFIALVQGTSTSLSLVFHYARSAEVLVNIVWLATYLLATIGLFTRFGMNWITWLFRYRLLLVVLLLGVIASTFWSVDISLSAERAVHMIGSTLIAFFIGFSVPLKRIVSISACVFTAIMVCSAFLAIAAPVYGAEEYAGGLAWRGVVAGKNTLGFWASISCMLSFSMLIRPISIQQKLFWFTSMMLAGVCLYNSVSATSVLAMAVATVVVAGLYVSYRFRLGFVATLALAAIAMGIIVVLFQQINTAELIGRSGDLTGRAEVWSQTWQLILHRPITGYGYGTLWYPTDATVQIQQSLLDFTWIVFHAHNGFLQVASEIGLPLAVVALLMALQQMVEVVYCQYQRQQSGTLFVLAFSVALLLSNYSEARFLVNREMYWIFFIAMPISMLQQVSVVLRDDQLNPISNSLNEKQRAKTQDRAAARLKKREMKTRLKDVHSVSRKVDVNNSPGLVIDGQVTTEKSNP